MNKLSSLIKGIILLLAYLVVQLLERQGVLLPYHVQILSLCCINVILVVSLNLINGFTGQFSIGHAGFLAIGAYASAYLTVVWQAPFLLQSFAEASSQALPVWLWAFRPSVTWRLPCHCHAGFWEIIRVIILNTDAVGGARGFSGIPKYTTFGLA